jgi:hypothetical protein
VLVQTCWHAIDLTQRSDGEWFRNPVSGLVRSLRLEHLADLRSEFGGVVEPVGAYGVFACCLHDFVFVADDRQWSV